MWLILSVVCTGGALFGSLWVVAQPVARSGPKPYFSMARNPVNWVWPWVFVLAPLCEPFVPWTMRARLEQRLRLAGLHDRLSGAQLVALQLMVGVVALAVSVLAGVFWLEAHLATAYFWAFIIGLLSAWWPQEVLKQRGRQRQQSMLRDMPFLLDMTTLCVEAGLNLQGALHQAARHGPGGPLTEELQHALSDIRAGKERLCALQDMAERTQLAAMASLVAAMAQADQLGVSLGPLLRAQSDQRRSERFLRAEEQALKAPVKMLFPLVACIFPCTFLIIGFPVVHHILDGLA